MPKKNDNNWSKYQNLVLNELKRLSKGNDNYQSNFNLMNERLGKIEVRLNNIDEDLVNINIAIQGNGTKGLTRIVERHNTLFFVYGGIILAIISGIIKLAFWG